MKLSEQLDNLEKRIAQIERFIVKDADAYEEEMDVLTQETLNSIILETVRQHFHVSVTAELTESY